MRKLTLLVLALAALPATADTVIRSGTKGTSAEARVTSTPSGVNHQPLDIVIYDAAGHAVTVTDNKLDINANFTASDGLKVQVTNTGGTNLAGAGAVLPIRADPGSVATPVIPSSGIPWPACSVSAATATTECWGTPGVGKGWRILHVLLSNGGTAQSLQVVQGTGTNCGTGETAVTPVLYFAINGTVEVRFPTEMPLAAPNEKNLCCKPSGSTAFSCMITAFTQ